MDGLFACEAKYVCRANIMSGFRVTERIYPPAHLTAGKGCRRPVVYPRQGIPWMGCHSITGHIYAIKRQQIA